MKKTLILSLLLLTLSFLAFGQTKNSSKSEDILVDDNNIVTADTDLTEVQASNGSGVAPAISVIFLGVGFDVLLGTEQSIQLFESTVGANDFEAEPITQNFYEIPFIGTAYFVAGTRVFNSFDLYGRLGINYGHIAKEAEVSTFASLGLPGVSVDVNIRQNFFFTSVLGIYAHTGVGVNYTFKKFINVNGAETSSYSYTTRYLQTEDDFQTQFFANAGVGLSFRVGRSEGLSIGYNLRYYFSSIYNTDDYLLEDSSSSRVIRYGNNQLMHGINFEYLFFL